jgi:uncharacterized protein
MRPVNKRQEEKLSPRHLTIAAAALLALALPGSAFAHVTLQPNKAAAGQFTRLDVRVPNEPDDASTTKVEIRFPSGFHSVSYEEVPGWRVSVKRKKLDKPITQHGEEITEEIDRVTLTGSGDQGKIGPGQFKDFGLSVQVPDKAGTKLAFPAVQTYDNGEATRWIGAENADEPAPRVEVTAAEGEEHGSSGDGATGADGATGEAGESGEAGEAGTGESGGEESGDGGGDDSNTLSIIALIVGGLGLVTGGFALSSARRRS